MTPDEIASRSVHLLWPDGPVDDACARQLSAVTRALWRRVKRTGGAFGDEAGRISEGSAQIQGHLDRASASGGKLADASQRLAVSRARLDVQLEAVREARHTVRRLLWFLPGA